jgi:hypothetical protein
MQKLLSDQTEKRGWLPSGLSMVGNNKRYIFWFWLLNLTLAEFGAAAFRNQAHEVLDHSLLSARLVHGFDISVLIEMLSRPEFGPTQVSSMAAMYFVILFFVATALFIPGVFQGFASTYRLPRDEFFRACGRNLWRFIRLLIVAGIVMGVVAGALFAANGALVKKAGDSTNELLPFTVQMIGMGVIFLAMTALRIWFDLAEADIVLNDQKAVRKSIAAGFRHMWRSLARLVMSYIVITIFAAILLVGGIWAWMRFVPPDNVLRAFLVGQFTLFFLLIPRFWQRGVAVAYWQQRMVVPVVRMEPIVPTPIAAPVVEGPAAISAAPEAPAV